MHPRWSIALVALAVLVASGAAAAEIWDSLLGPTQPAPAQAQTQAGCAGSAAQSSTGLAARSSNALGGAADVVGAVPGAINAGATRVGNAVGLEGTSNKLFGKGVGMAIGVGGKAALAAKGLGMLGNKLAPDQAPKAAAEVDGPVAVDCAPQGGVGFR